MQQILLRGEKSELAYIYHILKLYLSVRPSVCPLREVAGSRLDPESQVGVSKHREAWTPWGWLG